MLKIEYDNRNFTFISGFEYVESDYLVFENSGDEIILNIPDLEGVEYIKGFDSVSIGSNKRKYLDIFYRFGRGDGKWTEFIELEGGEIINHPEIDPKDKLTIQVKIVRSGITGGDIKLTKLFFNGLLWNPSTFLDTEYSIIGAGESLVIDIPNPFKVFKIEGYEIDVSPEGVDYNIFWKFSQDNGRTFTEWEPLTNENISTRRINPIRFFKVSYLIENISEVDIKLYDIRFIGDFQDILGDYRKTNLFGVRSCCLSQGGGDECGSPIKLMDNINKELLYNPYNQAKGLQLLNKLSDNVSELFGYNVQYLVTDPDGNGIDYTLHEYGLFNIVCEGIVKATVDRNQFPDNQIKINQFDLSLFDTFQIQITKENFKSTFGIQRRPGKEDIVYFCDLNRLFIVDHSQQFRSFNNYAVYYNIVLKKYNISDNVLPANKSLEDRIAQLTKNSTIDETFGVENSGDKKSVANKPQLEVLTKDPVRLNISGFDQNRLIVRSLLENSTNIISKNYYDLSSGLIPGLVNPLTDAVISWRNCPKTLLVSDNLSYSAWFNINNIIDGEEFILYEHYDHINSVGILIKIVNSAIKFITNGDEYVSDTIEFEEGVWYGIVINLDQRMRKLGMYLRTRDVESFNQDEAKFLKSTKLREVYTGVMDLIPFEYDIESESLIRRSDMSITNIRLFNEVIPIDRIDITLNQYIVPDDSKYLIFADNANMRLILPNFKLISD